MIFLVCLICIQRGTTEWMIEGILNISVENGREFENVESAKFARSKDDFCGESSTKRNLKLHVAK